MTEKKHVFSKKKALAAFLLLAAVLAGAILLCLRGGAGADLSTPEGRELFLHEQGWEIDRSTEEHKTVIIPEVLEGVMEEYNRMQLAQEYDLSRHLGEKCEQYTYELTNYPGYDGKVFITIYVQGREIIAGDIHTTSIDGFMHGIKRSAE